MGSTEEKNPDTWNARAMAVTLRRRRLYDRRHDDNPDSEGLIEDAVDLDDPHLIAQVRATIAYLAWISGDFETCEREAGRAAAVFETADTSGWEKPERAIVLSNRAAIGAVLERRGQFAASFDEYMANLLTDFEQEWDEAVPRWLGNCYDCQAMLGDLSSAAGLLRLENESPEFGTSESATTQLMMVEKADGRLTLEKAQTAFEAASQAHVSSWTLRATALLIAELALDEGNSVAAGEALTVPAWNLGSSHGLEFEIQDARLAARRGNVEDARQRLAECAGAAERLRHLSRLGRIRCAQAEVELASDQHDGARKLLDSIDLAATPHGDQLRILQVRIELYRATGEQDLLYSAIDELRVKRSSARRWAAPGTGGGRMSTETQAVYERLDQKRMFEDLSKHRRRRAIALHDIRTHLGSLHLLQERIESGGAWEDGRPSAISIWSSTIEAMVRILEGVETSASGPITDQARPPTSCESVEVVTAVLSEQVGAMELRAQRLESNIGVARAFVPLSASELGSVVANIVSNACKFSPRGAEIIVAMDRSLDAAGRPIITVEVTDAGPGMSAADQLALWKPYQRGSAGLAGDEPGSGLGLSVAHGLVSNVGGRLSAHTGDGRTGTTFRVVLPESLDRR